ncbi:hypothetical protein EV121DRAFT_255271 [Schizophyllum commune]
MTVSKLLEALPNELIDQILCYVGQHERLDRRPSAYGVLSRVNRRLHTLALSHLFSTTILPVRKAIRDEYVLSPALLARFIALLASNPMYKQHISADRRTPWDLRSFTSLTIGCSLATMPLLETCNNLQHLSMRWVDSDGYPDLSIFSNLVSFRLVGRALALHNVGDGIYDQAHRARACPSLRTLHLQGDVMMPAAIVNQLHDLHPHLRVFSTRKTSLTPRDILDIVRKHPELEEVNADFKGQYDDCQLGAVMDSIRGRVGKRSRAAVDSGTSTGRERHAWRELLVDGFACVRTKQCAISAQDNAQYHLDSLAIRLRISDTIVDLTTDHLAALLDQPADFPFQDLRHFAVSFSQYGTSVAFTTFKNERTFRDFTMRLCDVLSQWSSLETFTFHHDLEGRRMDELETPFYFDEAVPLLDEPTLPSDLAYVMEFAHNLDNHLDFLIDSVRATALLWELSRILGRKVERQDDIDLDEIWMQRHRPGFARCAGRLAEACPRLRVFRWYLGAYKPIASLAYTMHREEGGELSAITEKLALRGKFFPFEMLAGQELRVARRSWGESHA